MKNRTDKKQQKKNIKEIIAMKRKSGTLKTFYFLRLIMKHG